MIRVFKFPSRVHENTFSPTHTDYCHVGFFFSFNLLIWDFCQYFCFLVSLNICSYWSFVVLLRISLSAIYSLVVFILYLICMNSFFSLGLQIFVINLRLFFFFSPVCFLIFHPCLCFLLLFFFLVFCLFFIFILFLFLFCFLTLFKKFLKSLFDQNFLYGF